MIRTWSFYHEINDGTTCPQVFSFFGTVLKYYKMWRDLRNRIEGEFALAKKAQIEMNTMMLPSKY